MTNNTNFVLQARPMTEEEMKDSNRRLLEEGVSQEVIDRLGVGEIIDLPVVSETAYFCDCHVDEKGVPHIFYGMGGKCDLCGCGVGGVMCRKCGRKDLEECKVKYESVLNQLDGSQQKNDELKVVGDAYDAALLREASRI